LLVSWVRTTVAVAGPASESTGHTVDRAADGEVSEGRGATNAAPTARAIKVFYTISIEANLISILVEKRALYCTARNPCARTSPL
jgi:hypothetical protein